MEPRNGQWQAGLFLAAVIAGLGTLAYTALHYRWWLPPLASRHGGEIDRLFIITLILTGLVFVAVHLLLALFVFRYRHRDGRRAHHYAENNRLEVVWTLIPAAILIGLIAMGGRAWYRIHSAPPAGAFQAEVVGQQFKWAFRYPGEDGVFGRINPELIDEQDNPLGIDLEDPAAGDDVFFPAGQGELHLPVNRPCLILIRSKDVMHSFYLPNFRVKMDAVPGMTTRFWFTPTRTGEFELACAELCGLGHYQMRAKVVVEEEAVLQEWLSRQSTAKDLIW